MNILRRSFLKTFPSMNVYRKHPVRTIFTKDTLGITTYVKSREISKGSSPRKLLEVLEDENNKWINRYPFDMLVDDLRRFVHVVEPEQIDLLKKALKAYRVQSLHWLEKDATKESYKFGSIVMRFLSHFKMPEVAVQFYFDDQIGPLFDELAAYTILLDLLYDVGKYEELIEIHKISSKDRMRPRKMGSTFISINAIVFAACIQLNTPKYRQYAYDLYEQIKNENLIEFQLRKGILQVAEMKRRDNQPEECLKILSEVGGLDVSARYINILALLDLNRFQEALQLLYPLVRMKDFSKVFPVPKQLLELVKSKLIAEKQELTDIYLVSKELEKMGRTTDRTLNDAICHPYPKRLVLFCHEYRYTRMHTIRNQ